MTRNANTRVDLLFIPEMRHLMSCLTSRNIASPFPTPRPPRPCLLTDFGHSLGSFASLSHFGIFFSPLHLFTFCNWILNHHSRLGTGCYTNKHKKTCRQTQASLVRWHKSRTLAIRHRNQPCGPKTKSSNPFSPRHPSSTRPSHPRRSTRHRVRATSSWADTSISCGRQDRSRGDRQRSRLPCAS